MTNPSVSCKQHIPAHPDMYIWPWVWFHHKHKTNLQSGTWRGSKIAYEDKQTRCTSRIK